MKQFLALFFLFGVGFSEQEKAGIRVRVTRKGLDYICALGPKVLDQEIRKVKFPKVELAVKTGPGHGMLTLENTQLTEFVSPNFSYAMEPPHGLNFKSQGGKVAVFGHWEAWYKVLWKVWISGQIKATAEDISLTVGAKVSKRADGLPLVNVTDCSAQFGDFHLEIGGGVIQYLVNIFKYQISKAVKSEIENQICVAAKGVLVDFANKEIETLPTVLPVYSDFYLHYGLTKDPLVTEDYVESQMRAEITWKGEARTPVPPVVLPDVPTPANASRMLYLWGSDYVINTFLYSAHKHGAIQFLVSKSVDPKLSKFLKTTCEGICIGKLIPEIGERYPNTSVELHVYTAMTAPDVEIQPSEAILNATTYADVYAEPMNVTQDLMFRARIQFSGGLDVFVHRGRVMGNLTINLFEIGVVESRIGHISQQALGLIEKITRPVLQDVGNYHLRRGLRIPTIEGVGLGLARIRLLERAAEIQTNIKYKRFYARKLFKTWKRFRK